MSPRVTVRQLFDAKEGSLELELLTPGVPLEGRIEDPDVSSPGLSLAGYTARFPEGRAQVYGKTEMSYLATLDAGTVRERLDAVFAHEVPAVFVTRSQDVPPAFVVAAEHASVPVFRTRLATGDFYRALKPYLEDVLAPATTIHGSLADVYGIGLLFTGPSGVGKSECVLGLLERGHRIVADDLVFVSRRGADVLMGKGSELQAFHMEIRGIGIVDVASMFGTRAIRQRKRVEVIVDLRPWDETRAWERTGLDRDSATILGVRLPRMTIPVNAGKNLTVIAEVVAMNQLLAYSGVDVPARFDDRLRHAMSPRDSLVEDYE